MRSDARCATLAEEVAGTASNEQASRYTYFRNLPTEIEFLRRPANLHNGFDFLVCVGKLQF